jgi:hypothetical protein
MFESLAADTNMRGVKEMKITVRPWKGHDKLFLATASDPDESDGVGKSAEEAIGSLIKTHGDRLGIEIEIAEPQPKK